MMTFGSLFAGIGGFDLGLERAGMRCLWQVEKDDKARGVLSARWPNAKRIEDVKKAGKQNLNSVDVICGGFPCQDLSLAGKREGLAGKRSSLWSEFRRIIAELEPTWVIIENVPGLLSSSNGRDMGTVLGELGQLGYWWTYRVLDAQFFGVPQRRRRVFIVASTRKGYPQQVLFESDGSPWDTPPRRKTGPGFAAAITERTRDAGRTLEIQEDIAYALTDPGSGGRPHSRLIAFAQNSRDEVRIVNGNGSIAGALSSQPGMKQQTYIDATLNSSGNNGGFRPEPGEHLVTSNFGARRLTPLECERLQGFPDNWTNVNNQSDTARYKQLGNAVAVPVAYWLGKRLMLFA